jgi:integrase
MITARWRTSCPWKAGGVNRVGRSFAVDALRERRTHPYLGELTVIFPSTAGTLRDPNNFGKQWRKVRDQLGEPGVTTHSFRKTVATLIDEEGLSARVGADHLGHSKVDDAGSLYVSRARACRGCRAVGPRHKGRIKVGSSD